MGLDMATRVTVMLIMSLCSIYWLKDDDTAERSGCKPAEYLTASPAPIQGCWCAAFSLSRLLSCA